MKCDARLVIGRCGLPALFLITNGTTRVFSCSTESHVGQLVVSGVLANETPVTITVDRARRVV